MRVECTYFVPGEKARGKRFATPWQPLCGRLGDPQITSAKSAAPGISLATFRGNHRTLANVEKVYAVGLDLDHDVPAWEDVVHLFSDCDAFIHSTWSSTAENLRLRIFLLLSRPVSGDEYRRVYRAVVERAEGRGLTIDRAASDPSRFWYLPSIPPGAAFLSEKCTGRPVNIDWALATVPAAAPPPPPPPPTPASGDNTVLDRARRWLSVRDPAIEGSGGDRHTFETAVAIVRGFDLGPDDAYALLAEWNMGCKPPWTERDLRRKVREADERSTAQRGFLRDARRSA